MLPNELIDYILDKLYFDTATLLKCALVARAWVYSSQRGIFREIRLDPQFDEEPRVDDYLKISESLAAIFAKTPRLASYVRLLELQNFTKPNFQAKPELLNAFVSIVQHLSDVKQLELFDVNWKFLSPSLRSALTGLIRANSLTGITLLFFSIPTFAELVSLLGENTYLKVLETNVTCDVWDVPDSSTFESDMDRTVATNPPRSIRLDRLQFHGQTQISSFLTWFRQDLCPFEVKNLQLLHLGSSISSDLAVQVLQYVGGNLSGLMLAFFQDDFSAGGSYITLHFWFCSANDYPRLECRLPQIHSQPMQLTSLDLPSRYHASCISGSFQAIPRPRWTKIRSTALIHQRSYFAQ